ncbi:MAG: hypothetical protein QM820_25370 [Minicystis sp.]
MSAHSSTSAVELVDVAAHHHGGDTDAQIRAQSAPPPHSAAEVLDDHLEPPAVPHGVVRRRGGPVERHRDRRHTGSDQAINRSLAEQHPIGEQVRHIRLPCPRLAQRREHIEQDRGRQRLPPVHEASIGGKREILPDPIQQPR